MSSVRKDLYLSNRADQLIRQTMDKTGLRYSQVVERLVTGALSGPARRSFTVPFDQGLDHIIVYYGDIEIEYVRQTGGLWHAINIYRES